MECTEKVALMAHIYPCCCDSDMRVEGAAQKKRVCYDKRDISPLRVQIGSYLCRRRGTLGEIPRGPKD
jgi:hypothetical protein